jgi:hypothetical protein
MKSMEELAMENRVVSLWYPCEWFFLQAHIDPRSRLTEECKFGLTKEEEDAKPSTQ